MDYIKGKGIFVGTYNETDIKAGKDKAEVNAIMEKTGYQYTNQQVIEKNGNPVAIKLWVCDINDCDFS